MMKAQRKRKRKKKPKPLLKLSFYGQRGILEYGSLSGVPGTLLEDHKVKTIFIKTPRFYLPFSLC